jgi:translation initiation factor IF-2
MRLKVTTKDKKLTLGVKQGTLGIKREGSGDRLSLGISPTTSTSTVAANSRSSNKGKVVVVTKSRGAKKVVIEPNMQPAHSGGSFLTESEKEKRLEAIKLASQRRETLSISDEQFLADEQQNSEQDRNIEATIQNHSEEAQQNDNSTAEPEPAQIRGLHEVMGKNRGIKNLDSLYRPEKTEEEKQTTSYTKPEPTYLKQKKAAPKDNKFQEEAEAANARRGADERKAGRKLSVAQVMMMDEEGNATGGQRRRSMASIKRAREKARRKFEGSLQQKPVEKVYRVVSVPDFLSVQDLANRMAEKSTDVVKSLMKMGMMVTVNQIIDADTAELVIHEFGHRLVRVTESEIESTLVKRIEDDAGSLKPRPPVVTIMGHVDHGKTSLLDALRQTDVASGEAGGITQHIGAYQVRLQDGKMITFLDTPGHEAFTAMRMRGANVTDVVVLVVAADDGIMPQTIEAISHAKAAKVPIIVAINKIDKPEADVMRVKHALLTQDLVPEDMGGDIIVVEVSAKQKLNLEKLEAAILLQAEILEMKANPDRAAEGAIVESKVDKGRGPVATLLIQKGTLKVGDMVVAGVASGRIRALINDKGASIPEAGPSMPIEVLGLDQAPIAGDEFIVTKDEKSAKELVDFRSIRERQKRIIASKQLTLEQMFNKAKAQGTKELPIIIKADVQGSVEAISNSLEKLNTEEIGVRILHSAVGGITESDITLAGASKAIVIGFNVRATTQSRDLAKSLGVEIKYYSIIYKLVDEIKAAMGGMLSPTVTESITGYAEIREVFNVPKFGKVAGCYVTEGTIKRNSQARLIRSDVVIYEGKLKALKRFKDDVKEVNQGFECGMSFENYEDIKSGDKIEAFEFHEQARVM